MIDDVLTTAREALTVKRVYGDPYERDGVTVVPVATVSGGGGGGVGQDADGQEGRGGGFGMSAKPAGMYVIAAGEVRWRPAIDVNKLAVAFASVTIVAIIARARLERLRIRHRSD